MLTRPNDPYCRGSCCEARGFWRGMGNAINAYIDRITLADVLEGNVEA